MVFVSLAIVRWWMVDSHRGLPHGSCFDDDADDVVVDTDVVQFIVVHALFRLCALGDISHGK